MKKKPAADLRQEGIDARRSMSSTDRNAASGRIASWLIRSHEFAAAGRIACYLPMANEVDPGRIIARAWRIGKDVYVPVVTSEQTMLFTRLDPDSTLSRNRMGIWEPAITATIAPRNLDLVVTPLVAFDAAANRIGMGGGFYDRHFSFLKNRRQWLKPKLIGVAFACQQVPVFAPNPWDVRLYGIATEAGLLRPPVHAPGRDRA